MGDSLGKVVAISLAAILMFIFPLMEVLNRQDDVVQASVQAACERFISDVRASREITEERYAAFMAEINATGNNYLVELEHKVADENPGKKTAQATADKIGENIYYSKYTDQILSSEEGSGGLYDPLGDGRYNLKQGDYIGVTVKITNKTIAGLLQGALFGSDANKFEIAGAAARNGDVINEITKHVYYICDNNIANYYNY